MANLKTLTRRCYPNFKSFFFIFQPNNCLLAYKKQCSNVPLHKSFATSYFDVKSRWSIGFQLREEGRPRVIKRTSVWINCLSGKVLPPLREGPYPCCFVVFLLEELLQSEAFLFITAFRLHVFLAFVNSVEQEL